MTILLVETPTDAATAFVHFWRKRPLVPATFIGSGTSSAVLIRQNNDNGLTRLSFSPF
ncbi:MULTISPECIES: hypothetical protein [unclassified Sphingobacterium]|uniref:hypothetical protein n=1 Tax=unclassified Sphingobacterium TaxID=2609468 RepID=UPI0025F39913|nr:MULTISPECIES: hypothetical protein [unclassified Sphingobacterium]